MDFFNEKLQSYIDSLDVKKKKKQIYRRNDSYHSSSKWFEVEILLYSQTNIILFYAIECQNDIPGQNLKRGLCWTSKHQCISIGQLISIQPRFERCIVGITRKGTKTIIQRKSREFLWYDCFLSKYHFHKKTEQNDYMYAHTKTIWKIK